MSNAYRVVSGKKEYNFNAHSPKEAVKLCKEKFDDFTLYLKYYNEFPLPDEGNVTLHEIYNTKQTVWAMIKGLFK